MSRRRRERDRIEPRALSDLLPKVYPGKEPDDVRVIRAFQWWEKAVPPRVLANARPVRISRGVLTIHTATSVWANELKMLEPQLLESLHRRSPKAGVRSLRIKVGPLPPMPISTRRERRQTPVVPVTALPEELARALAGVADDSVREAVAMAAGISLGRPRRGDPGQNRP